MKWLIMILDTITFIWAVMAMLRLLLQKGGLAYSHPLASLLHQSTQWIVGKVRKLIPPIRGWDIAIPISVFLVLLSYEFLVLVITLFFMNVDKSVMGVLVTSNILTVTLKVFSAFVHALFYELIAYYFLEKNPRDVQLLRAIDFSINQILMFLKPQYKPKLIAFIVCTLWILVFYPEIMYRLQMYMIF